MKIPPPFRLAIFSASSLLAVHFSSYAQTTPIDLSISASHFAEWGGRVPGEVVEQGEGTNHAKVIFRAAENAQKRSEIGLLLTPELPEFNKATMELFSNVDTRARIRLGDASDNPFIVTTNLIAGTWTKVEFILDEKSGKNWPPQGPYKSLAILATTAPGTDEQIFEIKDVQLSKE